MLTALFFIDVYADITKWIDSLHQKLRYLLIHVVFICNYADYLLTEPSVL